MTHMTRAAWRLSTLACLLVLLLGACGKYGRPVRARPAPPPAPAQAVTPVATVSGTDARRQSGTDARRQSDPREEADRVENGAPLDETASDEEDEKR